MTLADDGQARADGSSEVQWIWSSGDAQDDQTVYFRKVFHIEGSVKSARLVGTCDNAMAVFANDQSVLSDDDWSRPLGADVAAVLKKGPNVLAVEAKNDGSAGLLLRLTIELADGSNQTIVTDPSWQVSTEAAKGWRSLHKPDGDWRQAVALGALGTQPWGNLDLDNVSFDTVEATPAADIQTQPGFVVERLYSVPKPIQGSWVSMTSDDKGDLIVSDQYGGLYRVTPGDSAATTVVRPIPVEIGEAHGLLWAHDSLYVVVNGEVAQGSGLYRVTDEDGDGELDTVKLLRKLAGNGEHGPHAVRLGPDGALYVIAGNHTKLPEDIDPLSPHRNWDEDLLLPRNPDGGGHANGVMAPGGWIARTDADGKTWTVLCGGFRNAFDFDFNQDGEILTFDADMEWDTGAPWYRPTRINHATSGAEFGWRYGTGKWPAYFPDSVGAVVDIGLGSPTGVCFGTGAMLPAKYQRALFACDWTYGKLYAVFPTPKGASYSATFETFLSGKPLPLTDVIVHTDRQLYFTIGGRKTQSGLYRVTYQGDESTAPVGPIEDADAAEARETRRMLESLHGHDDPQAVEIAWPYLNSDDRALRYAGRVAIESQPVETWREKALAETNTNARIQALIALARCGSSSDQAAIVERLDEIDLGSVTEEQTLDALRAYALAFIRLGKPSDEVRAAALANIDPHFPGQNDMVNRELCRLLVYLDAPKIVPRALEQMRLAQTQQDQMYYIFLLRNVADGWTLPERETYFGWLQLAESKYVGGHSFARFLVRIREDALATVSDEDRDALADVLTGKAKVDVADLETTRQFVHNWQESDIVPLLPQTLKSRSFATGRLVFHAAQCHKCHRVGGDGGATGPDLTGAGNRFSPRDLLESVIFPSKVVSDQYRNATVVTNDGRVITGRIVDEDDSKIRIRTNPYGSEMTELPKDAIEQRTVLDTSEMPTGLINVLTQDEILDLIAYLRSGGNAADPAFAEGGE
ncbi:MAG: c-type cytochrome [Pirellulales bacterium]